MEPNLHNVPKKQWKHWSSLAQSMFNENYSLLKAGQSLFTHPQSVVLTEEQWNTVCWNAAWLASDNYMKLVLK